jgi:hypothetical protein
MNNVKRGRPAKRTEENTSGNAENYDDPEQESYEEEAMEESVNGWLAITEAQKTGDQFIVSEEPEGEGVKSFWRRTRKRQDFKWVECGKWSDCMTKQSLSFEPYYYKEVHSEKKRG